MFFLFVITAFNPAFVDEKEDQAAFKKAYATYQEALKSHNNQLLFETAKEAYETGLIAFGKTHTNTANLALNYAHAANLSNRKDEAKTAIDIAEDLYVNLYGEASPEMVDIYLEKAKAYLEVFKDRRTGTRYYRKALALTQKHSEKDSLLEGTIHFEIGEMLLHEAQASEAINHLKKARKILSKEGDASKSYLAKTDFLMGKYYIAKKRYSKATEMLNSSLSIYEEIAPKSQITLINHAFLVRAYEEQSMSDMATKHCQAIGASTPVDQDRDYLPVYRAHPIYPLSAQRIGREGYAIVELTVNENGFVENPQVIENGGHKAFKKAAIDAALKHRYAPRFENGKPIKTEGVKYRFSFEIAN